MEFLLGLATISLTILIHEFGHYFVACWQGVKVSRFSLFFGPTLWEKTWRGTSFCLSLIPFGGYCQMQRDGQGGLYSKSWLSKCLVSIAGPVANIVLGFFLLFVFFAFFRPLYDTRVVVPQTLENLDNPFYEAGLRSGDILLSVNANKLSSFMELEQSFSTLEPEENVVFVYKRDGKVAKIELRLSTADSWSKGWLIPWSEPVLYTVPEELASKLQPLDRFLSINAKNLNSTADIADYASLNNESVVCIIEQDDGSTRKLKLSAEQLQILLSSRSFVANNARKEKSLAQIGAQSVKSFLLIVKFFFTVFFEFFTGQLAVQDVFTGPLQTAQLIGQNNASLADFIQKFSLLNFILALSNLIPLAGLDGGTLFFHTFELFLPARKRKKVRQLYGLLSFVFILCLFAFILSLDLINFLREL